MGTTLCKQRLHLIKRINLHKSFKPAAILIHSQRILIQKLVKIQATWRLSPPWRSLTFIRKLLKTNCNNINNNHLNHHRLLLLSNLHSNTLMFKSGNNHNHLHKHLLHSRIDLNQLQLLFKVVLIPITIAVTPIITQPIILSFLSLLRKASKI